MLQTKALYNLLRLNAADDPTVASESEPQSESWALEDLRAAPVEELLSRLEQYGVRVDRHGLVQFAEQCDTPEALTELLFPDEAPEPRRDPFYLVIFELWRRFIPEKQSLSIFCDELDHRISLYDEGEMESDEPIQDALANLMEVLDENVDTGADPEEIFLAISEYCAHDLESFLIDYISDLLDSGNALYASDLIEGFSSYVSDPCWFDFLKIRLIAFTDIGEANIAMHRLLEQDLEPALLLEVIRFLSICGEHALFKAALHKSMPHLKTQEELVEVMSYMADYYRRLDEEEQEQAIQRVLDGPRPVQVADLQALLT